MRRGLTLIEVLCATAILVLATAAVLPAMSRSSDVLTREMAPTRTLTELAELADAAIDDESLLSTETATASIPWPTAPERPPVLAQRIGEESENGLGEWWSFEHAGVRLLRWRPTGSKTP